MFPDLVVVGVLVRPIPVHSQTVLAGGGRYARHEINNQVVRKQVLLVTTNPQLDALFEQHAL
jgi:hypothetical protein